MFDLDQNLETQTTPKSTTPSAKCGSNWLERPFSNFCYHFSTKINTFSKAEQECQTLGGSLVSILGVDEQLFLQSIILSQKFDCQLSYLKQNSNFF